MISYLTILRPLTSSGGPIGAVTGFTVSRAHIVGLPGLAISVSRGSRLDFVIANDSVLLSRFFNRLFLVIVIVSGGLKIVLSLAALHSTFLAGWCSSSQGLSTA